MTEIVMQPIGTVVGGRRNNDDDAWGAVNGIVRLDDRFDPAALHELDTFSHIEVVFVFDRLDPKTVHTGTRRPRGRADWPEVGVFAQRMSNRPNRIGVSRCEVLSVDGRDVHVRGLDAMADSPVLDIKPWFAEMGPRGAVRQPDWTRELMAGYYDAEQSTANPS